MDKKAQTKLIYGFIFLVLLIGIFSAYFVFAGTGEPFTITEHTEYDILQNTIYLNITENLGKDQIINVTHVFDNNLLTNKIEYTSILMLQDVPEEIYSLVNTTINIKNKEIIIVNGTNITNYYDDLGNLLSCSYVRADEKVCYIEKEAVNGTKIVQKFIPIPNLKEKLVTSGLKIEMKQEGIPLPKNSVVQLKMTYNHPLAIEKNKPTTKENKYDIFVISLNGLENTTLDPTWWNASWNSSKEIKIQENSGKAQTNYSVWMNISYISSMSNNFSDLRFTNESKDTELKYYIESQVNGNFAQVWILVPNLASSVNTSIYMYYGNTASTTTSDRTTAFLLFDDFSTNPFSGYKWKCSAAACTWDSVNHKVSLHSGDRFVSTKMSYNKSNFSNVEIKVQESGLNSLDWFGIEINSGENAVGVMQVGYAHHSNPSPAIQTVGGPRYPVNANWLSASNYTFGWFNFSSSVTTVNLTGKNETRLENLTGVEYAGYNVLDNRYITLHNRNQDSVSFDDVRIRRYVLPEPTVYIITSANVNNSVNVSQIVSTSQTINRKGIIDRDNNQELKSTDLIGKLFSGKRVTTGIVKIWDSILRLFQSKRISTQSEIISTSETDVFSAKRTSNQQVNEYGLIGRLFGGKRVSNQGELISDSSTRNRLINRNQTQIVNINDSIIKNSVYGRLLNQIINFITSHIFKSSVIPLPEVPGGGEGIPTNITNVTEEAEGQRDLTEFKGNIKNFINNLIYKADGSLTNFTKYWFPAILVFLLILIIILLSFKRKDNEKLNK